MQFEINEVESRINYVFKDKSLLIQAFTHSSFSNENNVVCNERLEFLGDSILGFIIADEAYKKFTDYREGDLTKYKSSVVKTRPLGEAINDLGIAKYMLLGQGERRSHENKQPKEIPDFYADLFESIVAAIYLDSGLSAAKIFIFKALKNHIKSGNIVNDYKSKLSEHCQKHKLKFSYKIVKQEGPPHSRLFTVNALIDGVLSGQGKAESIKKAEQKAAKAALGVLMAGGTN